MITLKDFVKDTLTQIVDAATEFVGERGKVGATTNPRVDSVKAEDWAQHGLLLCRFDSDRAIYATVVEFDVAVSAEETMARKGEGGVRVISVLKAEGGIEAQRSNTSANRIRFKLPLQIDGELTDVLS